MSRPDTRQAPIWRQILEGIGLVAALSAAVTVVGIALAAVVTLLF